MRFREYISELSSMGMLEEIDEASPRFEAAYHLKRLDGRKAVLFKRLRGSSYRAVGNLFSNRRMLYRVLGVKDDVEAFNKLLSALKSPVEPSITSRPPELRSIGSDLFKLPIFTFYERDAGPYVTGSIVVARDVEEGFMNSSFHRMLLLDERHAAVRIVPRHLYRMYNVARSKGRDLEVAVVIGATPYFYISSAASPPYGVYELDVANALAGGKLDAFILDYGGLVVPEDSEIVILGRLLHDRVEDEGPFVDITGTYDIVRKQPVLEVDDILARGDAIYYSILPAGMDHRTLMGFPREARIYGSVSMTVPRVKAVRLTSGGCGWLSAVVSVAKQSEGDGKNVIMAAFAAHPSLKIVIVVDEDIDVDNPVEVEWALATRMQPDEDVVIVRNARGSSLDPSSDQERLLTSKMGIDATRPLDRSLEEFEKARIPYP